METGKNSALRDSSYWIVTIFHFRPYFASLGAFQVFNATAVRRWVFALNSEVWRRSWPFRRHFNTSKMKVQEILWQVISLHKEYTYRKEFVEGKFVCILKWNYQNTSLLVAVEMNGSVVHKYSPNILSLLSFCRSYLIPHFFLLLLISLFFFRHNHVT